MITESTIYWVTRLDYLQTLIIGLGIGIGFISLLWLVLSCFSHSECYGSEKSYCNKHIFGSLVSFIFSICLLVAGCFIPNTKEVCAMKILPKVINNEEVQKLPNKVVELANEWLDELKPKKNIERKQNRKDKK